MGCVKTAHRQYPMAFIKDWHNERVINKELRGGWITLRSTFEHEAGGARVEYPMYAVGWHDKTCKTIVSNIGTTVAAATASQRRWSHIVDVEGIPTTVDQVVDIPRPAMLELFYECFSVIDVNDHMRQGILGIERAWTTTPWVVRLFGTIVGVGWP